MSGAQKLPVAEQAENPRVGEHGALSCGRALSFSRETRDDFERLLARYPTKQAALLPTLWLAQREWGWISREAVDYVAALLGPVAGIRVGRRDLLHDVQPGAGRQAPDSGLHVDLLPPERRKRGLHRVPESASAT